MRIIVMGTGPFAVPTAQKLLESGHEIPLVVTRPLVDSSAKKKPPRPVYDWAQSASIDIFEPGSINSAESIAELRKYEPDLFFVCDYGQILSNNCLSAAQLGGINLHGSILPRHRGAAPVQWALLRGDTEAGVTVIHMTPRLDAGPALSVARTQVRQNENAAELEPRLAELGVQATIEAVELLQNWDRESTVGEVQDQTLVTRAPRFSKLDGQLDFRLSAEYLVRLVRACQPWPGTYAELTWPSMDTKQGKTMRLIVRSAASAEQLSHPSLINTTPGSVASISSEEIPHQHGEKVSRRLSVQTGNGVLLIDKVQPAGKREMDAEEFLRGHPLQPGCKFQLPNPAKVPLA